YMSAFTQNRPKVGLVLSGGGAAGLAHIGVIKVIEEAGIPIDYIGGTSMGSIVGAMYAIGYTPEEMTKLISEQDWETLLSDKVPRKDQTLEVKEGLEKYFYSFPISRKGIELPSGLVAGHNIINMLAGLTWAAYDIRDFSKLPIPFLCIGANIVTGEEVVLNSGILHDALRASMAIPTAFTAVEVDDKLMIDGGFINNFPADYVKRMGADIIIGVDVQRDLRKKSELNSMISILKQVSALVREDANERNRELCDILIRPNTPGASTLSFNMVDNIIADGESTALEHWDELKALGDNLKDHYPDQPVKRIERRHIDSLFVRELKFTGLERISQKDLLSKMNLPFPAWLTPDDISQALQRAYGTNYFNRVSYQLDPVSDGARLTIRAEEKGNEVANIGVHFDNLFNASLMLNANIRNLWKKGDRLSVDATLGENPHLGASYFFLTHKKQNYGISTRYDRLTAYDYLNGNKINSYVYHDVLADIMLRTTYHDVFAVSTGFQAEFASLAPSISLFEISAFNSRMLNYYVEFNKDNFNSVPYPTKGEKVEINMKLINNFTDDGVIPAVVFHYRHKFAFELSPRISLQPSVNLGFAFGDSIPFPYRSYIGGLGYYNQAVFPFVGMHYMERAANHAIVIRGDLQYQIKGNHYFLWRNNIAQSFDNFNQMIILPDIIFGTGLTYGFASPVGPIEATIMISNNTWRPALFVNIGYWIR
ncbi:MAG: patatin-like phospholipase family protein, partial [Bacteroidales bacterium]|nr:patatin-like phospholipase family protein [Bacteroidales bacterium]